MLNAVPIAKAAPAWSPSRFQAPGLRANLGQSVTTTPTTPPGVMVPVMEIPKPPFIDSALVSFAMSALGASAYGLLAYAYDKSGRPTWSKIFFATAAVFSVKAVLYDLPAVRTR